MVYIYWTFALNTSWSFHAIMIVYVLTVLHHAGDYEGLKEGVCELLQGLDGVQGLLHHLGAEQAGLSHGDERRHCRCVSKNSC